MRTAATLTALAEPTRLRIVEMLRHRPAPVGEIAQRLAIRQPQASKHLRVLSRVGIVAVRPRAQQRIYHLQAQPFKELDEWLAEFRRLWEVRLDRFDAYLQKLKRPQPKHPKKRPLNK